ncbi:MAG: ExbD/TolR family protein [Tabrizicola sp.]
MFRFGPLPRRRRADLTPMIDVVFLLLVFFMLASHFARDTGLPARTAGDQSAEWPGPPRLVDLGPADSLALNGVAVAPEHLPHALEPLTASPDDPIILRPRGADVQALVSLIDRLTAAGFTRLIVME